MIDAGELFVIRCAMREPNQPLIPRWWSLLLLLACSCAGFHSTGLKRFEFSEPQMGLPFRIVLYAPDKPTAETSARAAFDRIQRLNAILSDYDTDSELSRLSQTAGSGGDC